MIVQPAGTEGAGEPTVLALVALSADRAEVRVWSVPEFRVAYPEVLRRLAEGDAGT